MPGYIVDVNGDELWTGSPFDATGWTLVDTIDPGIGSPQGCAVDPATGDVYVTAGSPDRLVRLNSTSAVAGHIG